MSETDEVPENSESIYEESLDERTITKTDAIERLVKEFETSIDNYDIIKAMNWADEALCVFLSLPVRRDDETILKMAMRLHYQLRTDLKYEGLIYQQAARHVSDTLLFCIQTFCRKVPNYQFFSFGRTLLTPHRRRQLMKTMNPEVRVFAMGSNVEHCLGLYSQHEEFVETLTELNMPAVYEIRTSGRHTVFWLHDGRFLGCGFTRSFMVREGPTYLEQPVEIDIYFFVRKHETICGFKPLDFGTIFETDLRWYFVGDYPRSEAYLKTLHYKPFEPIHKATDTPNLWVCHTRPRISIMENRIDDAKNVAPMKFKTSLKMIQIYPTFWTELSPGFTARRPILYLLNGVEVTDLRLEHVRSGVVWVTYVGTLYNGMMNLLMREDNDGDEENLDNYILMIELQEYNTPTPFVVTGVSSFDDSVLVKCGDFPFVSFDHAAVREDQYRGANVHKFMFEMMEKYMLTPKGDDVIDDESEAASNTDGRSDASGESDADGESDAESDARNDLFTLDDVIEQAEVIMGSGQMEEPLELDVFNRITVRSRYANYFGFLAYISVPRLPDRRPKVFDSDIDVLLMRSDPKIVARHRIKMLFEEFERVNYPGTDVWKPTEFLRSQPDPEEDTSSEGEYRAKAMYWCLETFIVLMRDDVDFHDDEDAVDREVVQYLMNILYYANDLWHAYRNTGSPAIRKFIFEDVEAFEKKVPDTECFLKCMNPGAILESRIAEGYLKPEDLEMEKEVTLKFRLKHRDPKLDDTLYEVKTFKSIIGGQNSFFLKDIDADNVLDLNKAYPNDHRLHRLIAQTHINGHGLTDLTDLLHYEQTHLFKLGWTVVKAQSYLVKGLRRVRGYLFSYSSSIPETTLVSSEPSNWLNVIVTCSCGSIIYCHYIIPTLFSVAPLGTPLPATIPLTYMMNAIRGIYDRRIIEVLPMGQRITILDWYCQAQMPEAFEDLLRQCVVDATQKDTKCIRFLLRVYPTMTQRFIAEHRPGILLWLHTPVPIPRLDHIKIITEMWPKNEYERSPRLPQSRLDKNGKEKSVFRLLGTRQLKSWYTNGEERERPLFSDYYKRDFPMPVPEEIQPVEESPYSEDEDSQQPPAVVEEPAKMNAKERKKERRKQKRLEAAAAARTSSEPTDAESQVGEVPEDDNV